MNVATWFDRITSLNFLGNVVIAACGLLLLAEGFSKWDGAVTAKDLASGRSPLMYGDSISNTANVAGIRWTIILNSSDASNACALVRQLNAYPEPRTAVQILVVGQDPVSAQFCPQSAATVNGDGSLKRIPKPEPSPASGFVVVDSVGRVVYGARALESLSRVSGVLGLYRSM